MENCTSHSNESDSLHTVHCHFMGKDPPDAAELMHKRCQTHTPVPFTASAANKFTIAMLRTNKSVEGFMLVGVQHILYLLLYVFINKTSAYFLLYHKNKMIHHCGFNFSASHFNHCTPLLFLHQVYLSHSSFPLVFLQLLLRFSERLRNTVCPDGFSSIFNPN